jgi:hypothetical protein
MSIKENLIGKQYVKGNIKNFLQTYNLYYYPPEENFPTSKVRLSIFGEEDGKPRMIRSLYFENIENHRNFIFNNIFYQIYWLEKQAGHFRPSYMPIGEYRLKLMDAILTDLRKKLLSKLKEKSLEIKR